MITVLIADDHPVVQLGLGQALAALSDIELVGVAGTGKEALEKILELRPDVALLDLSMPEMNGIEATRQIKKSLPEVGVLIYSMQDREAFIHSVFRAGADGYVLKGAPVSEVAEAIRAVHRGDYYLGPQIQGVVLRTFLRAREPSPEEQSYENLSDREQQVLRLLVEGHSTARIGEMLFISPKTVEKHRANIMQKLAVDSMIDLIKFAMRINIVDPDEWKSKFDGQ